MYHVDATPSPQACALAAYMHAGINGQRAFYTQAWILYESLAVTSHHVRP